MFNHSKTDFYSTKNVSGWHLGTRPDLLLFCNKPYYSSKNAEIPSSSSSTTSLLLKRYDTNRWQRCELTLVSTGNHSRGFTTKHGTGRHCPGGCLKPVTKAGLHQREWAKAGGSNTDLITPTCPQLRGNKCVAAAISRVGGSVVCSTLSTWWGVLEQDTEQYTPQEECTALSCSRRKNCLPSCFYQWMRSTAH